MNRKFSARIKKILILVFLFGGSDLSAQKADSIPKVKTNYFSNDSSRLNFLAFSVTATSNRLETNRLSSKKIPQISSGLLYFSPIGFWLNMDYNHYFNTNEISYGASINVGYNIFFKNFDFDLNYNRNYFIGDPLIREYIFKQSINTNLSYSLAPFSLNLAANYINDIYNDTYIRIENAYYYEFIKLSEYIYVSTEPRIGFNFGSENWLINSTPFINLILQSAQSRELFEHKVFSFLGTEFFLPLSIQYSNFSIETQFYYYIPNKRYRQIDVGNQNAFIISLNYIFDLY